MSELKTQPAELKIPGVDEPIELPIYSGNLGPDVIDVGKLTSQGHFTYDPGFVSTAACESGITYIDGDEGTLLHRGYPIEQLADKSDYLELCYLLLNGELPNAAAKTEFVDTIKNHTMVNEQLRSFFKGFSHDAHPTAIMCGVVGALSAFYHDSTDIDNPQHRMITAHRLIAKMPTLAAMSYKHAQGQPFIYPRNDMGYAENFLHMMFATPCEEYAVSPTLAKAMDRIFLLHADHEQNASTSTVRLAGSTGANPFASVAAGIAALWGPSHGGANEAVLTMLEEIGSVDNIPEYVRRAGRGQGRPLPHHGLWSPRFIKTTTLAPRSCNRPVMRYWKSWVCKMTPYWQWRENSSALRWRTSTLLKNVCIRMWTSIRASS